VYTSEELAVVKKKPSDLFVVWYNRPKKLWQKISFTNDVSNSTLSSCVNDLGVYGIAY
jgi:hypothetical protein